MSTIFYLHAFSQKTTIKIQDKSSNLPIADLYWSYNNVAGVTEANGEVNFDYKQGSTLFLSHINYGVWELDESQLKQAIHDKVIYKESKAFDLFPVTVIGVQSSQTGETVDLDYDDKMAHDGGELLSQSTAISGIKKSGNYGFDPVLRGFKYDQLNIVLGGAQSATAACPNRMDPPTSQMAPNMIDRVEILKGPHSVRFGNGFGGTINFIPSPLQFSDSTQVFGRLSGSYESNGELIRNENLIGIRGQKYELGIFGSYSQGDDYTAGNDSIMQAAFLRESFGANLGIKLTDNQEIRLSANKNIARDVEFVALPMDLRNDDTWMFHAKHTIKLNKEQLKSWNTSVFGSFVDHEMDNLDKIITPRMMNAVTYATTYNYGGRTESIWQLPKGIMYLGGDLKVEGAEGTRERSFLMGPMAGKVAKDNVWQDGEIQKTALFTEYKTQKDSITFVLAGRLEINSASVSNVDATFQSLYNGTNTTEYNPTISVGAIKNIKKNSSVGIWIGASQRSGSLSERYINFFPVGLDPYEIVGNPFVKAETNKQMDLTFSTRTKKTAFKVDLFASYLEDYISSEIDTTLKTRLPSSPGVRRVVNIDNAFKTGFEISWKQTLVAGLSHQASIAYTYGKNLVTDNALAEIAPLDFQYIFSGSYLNKKITPQLIYRYVMEQNRVSTEFGETPSPSFNIVDVKVNYKITPQASVTVGVDNIFDTTYYEHLNRAIKGTNQDIYAIGRNVFISANIKF